MWTKYILFRFHFHFHFFFFFFIFGRSRGESCSVCFSVNGVYICECVCESANARECEWIARTGAERASSVFFSCNLIYAIVTMNCVICYFDICPKIKTNIAVLVLLMIQCLDFLTMRQNRGRHRHKVYSYHTQKHITHTLRMRVRERSIYTRYIQYYIPHIQTKSMNPFFPLLLYVNDNQTQRPTLMSQRAKRE